MERREVILAHGHLNILATNTKTLEITKESSLTTRGNCVVAVKANKGADDLDSEFKRLLSKKGSRLTITFRADDEEETIFALGHSKLPLSHPSSLVVRKSCFICERTLAINANKVAGDFSRSFVEKLRNPRQQVVITLSVNTPDPYTKRQ